MMSNETTRGGARSRVLRVATAATIVGGLFAVAPAVAFSSDPQYNVSASDTSVTIGDTVDVTVKADGIDDIYSYALRLGYDPKKLSYVGSSAKTDISGYTDAVESAGSVEVVHTKLGSSPSASGDDLTLITASFTAIADGVVAVNAGELTTVTSGGSSATVAALGAVDLRIAKKTAATVTKPPAISGTVRVGQVVTASPGQWNVSGLKFTYQWSIGGKPVAGARGAAWRLPASAVGKRATVAVTASGPSRVDAVAVASSTPVAKARTTAALSARPNKVKSGKSVKATFVVKAAGVTPTGTVTFRYRGKVIRKGVKLVGGKATVTFVAKGVGRKTLSATYVPAGGFTATSDKVGVRVVK